MVYNLKIIIYSQNIIFYFNFFQILFLIKKNLKTFTIQVINTSNYDIK
jgi:hypothetical protein